MAIDAVDRMVEVGKLKPKYPCKTENLTLVGGHEFTPTMYISMIQKFGLEQKVTIIISLFKSFLQFIYLFIFRWQDICVRVMVIGHPM